MYYDDENRKPRPAPAGQVAVLRQACKDDPARYLIPLAYTLRTLAGEYERVCKFDVARRHMNAAVRTMRTAAARADIPASHKRRIVGFLWDASVMWLMSTPGGPENERALAFMDEALKWDLATWDDYTDEYYCRELGRAQMLNIRARILWGLGREEEAADAHADAILTALSDVECDPEEVLAVVQSFSLTLA
jgi:hypothetical protein